MPKLVDVVVTAGDLPRCGRCGRRKKPIGRDAGIAESGMCVSDRGDGFGCPGYFEEPSPGYYWPGEFVV